MSFTAAVRSVLSQYAQFGGRARRAEYWWFVLFSILVGIAANIIDVILGTDSSGWGPVASSACSSTWRCSCPGSLSPCDACTTPTAPAGGS
ncbi:DUF805 domain-containing protein [Phytohabitans flavus]